LPVDQVTQRIFQVIEEHAAVGVRRDRN
jgi:hypothetical protein